MDSLEKARACALRLIKFRPRSEAELKTRLGREGFSASTIDTLLAELKRKDFVNDAKFARYFATQRMTMKPMSRRALAADLKSRGIEFQWIEQALNEATEGTDELETARALAQSRSSHLKGLKPEAAKRRLFGFLSRRGFSSDIAYRVIRDVTARGSHPRESEDQTPSSIRSRIPPSGGLTE